VLQRFEFAAASPAIFKMRARLRQVRATQSIVGEILQPLAKMVVRNAHALPSSRA
jgi:hypothetical protein